MLRQVDDARCNRDTDRTTALLAQNMLAVGDDERAGIAAEAAWGERAGVPRHQRYGLIELCEAFARRAIDELRVDDAAEWLERADDLEADVAPDPQLATDLRWAKLRALWQRVVGFFGG